MHLLIPVSISPLRWAGFTIRTVGDAMLGGLVMRGVMRAIEHILKSLLAFCVWLGGAYLLAMNNEALFGIFLGSSLIIGGIYLPPRLRTDQPQSS